MLFSIHMRKLVGSQMDKWKAKLRTSTFHRGIAFSICTNQFHLPTTAAKTKKINKTKQSFTLNKLTEFSRGECAKYITSLLG